MGSFNKLKKKDGGVSAIEKLINEPYSQQYFDECKYIWKNYVPERGQATCLQGELLREIEMIRYEAQDNGNVNWDDDYSYFCDFIARSLSEQPMFSGEEKAEIDAIMQHLKGCGQYAVAFASGEITANDLDPDRLAYTADNLYDIICDKIGKLQREYPEPMPYEHSVEITRLTR